MTDKLAIIQEINIIVGEFYHGWRIGMTNDPNWRRGQWKKTFGEDVSRWRDWETDCLNDAKAIHREFVEKGMPTAYEADATDMLTDEFTNYVYIF